MKHSTLILVIRRLSERAREAQERRLRIRPPKLACAPAEYWQLAHIERACRAKIDQLTERYS